MAETVNETTFLIQQPARNQHRRCPSFRLQNFHYACSLILVAQALERTVFYSVVGNLTYFLRLSPLCWTETNSLSATNLLTSAGLLSGLVSGMVSDSLFGRYPVILFSYILYILAQIWLMVLTFYVKPYQHVDFCEPCIPKGNESCPIPTSCKLLSGADNAIGWGETCGASLMLCLMMNCLAGGILHASLPTFGGEQLRTLPSKETTRRFFRHYYFAINCGSLLAALPMAYLQENGSVSYSFFYSFCVTGGCLLLSLILFLAGTKFYIRRTPRTSTIVRVIKLVFFAIKQKWINRRQRECDRPPSFLYYATHEFGGNVYSKLMVEDVISLWKVIRVLSLLLLSYMAAYGAIYNTFYSLQGLHMRVALTKDSLVCPSSDNVTRMINALCKNDAVTPDIYVTEIDSDRIPPAFLTSFDTGAVLLCLMVIGKIYSCFTRRHIKVTVKRRIVAGLVALTLSLFTAAAVEYFRIREIQSCGFFRQILGKARYYAANLSVFWQIPQYILLGVSEVLVVVTGLEFAFIESPESMQGLMIGLFWFVAGIGSILSIPIVRLVKLIPNVISADEINCNEEHYFMIILGGIALMGVVAVLIADKCCDLNLNREIKAARPQLTIESPPSSPLVAQRERIPRSHSVPS